MFRHITVVLFATLVVSLFLSTQYSFAKKVECEDGYKDMKWDATNHEPNDASSNDFEELAYNGSLCEISKCVDHEECTNHDEVNWKKFKGSPAYQLTSEDQQQCLDTAHDDGNGQDGLVGYEILDCGLNQGY